YGTFARMYSLLALVGGVNMLLFLRALERPTPRRVSLAAASAWLLAATHPFGLIPVAVEGAVGLYAWRGRGWVRALPALVAAAALRPLRAGEVRLAERLHVSPSNGSSMSPGGTAARQLDAAVRGFAGGRGAWTWLFVCLALLGGWVVLKRSPFFVVVAASALL